MSSNQVRNAGNSAGKGRKGTERDGKGRNSGLARALPEGGGIPGGAGNGNGDGNGIGIKEMGMG